MAVLGKRKARASEPKPKHKPKPAPASAPPTDDDHNSDDHDAQDIQDIFRRHFEAQFAPLPDKQSPSSRVKSDRASDDEATEDSGPGEGDDDEWGGLSEEDDEMAGPEDDEEDDSEDKANAVEVIDHSSSAPKTAAMSKAELKAFMSSRPRDPTSSSSSTTTTQTSSKTASKTLPEDAPSLLAQDLELRRLISESHLLAPKPTASLRTLLDPNASASGATEPKLFTDGRTRRKATDMRLQALGSKTSIYKQDKMPMNMRKGMVAARVAGEAKRRREAKENGIILERETGGAAGGVKKAKRKRDLGVDRPGIGRLKGAQLKISDQDVRSIENSRDTFGRKRR